MWRREIASVGINTLWADKVLIGSIPVFYLTLFLFYSWFPLNAAPILLSLAVFIPYLLVGKGRVPARYLGALLFLVLFSIWACSYLIIERGVTSIASMIFVFFLSLPLLFVAVARIFEQGEEKFIAQLFLFFLAWQCLVVLWQMVGRVSSVGFDPVSHYGGELPDSYTLMLTGTYYNSNDLAATVGGIYSFFVLLKGRFPALSRWGTGLSIFLVVCTASRAVMLFMIISMLYYSFSRSILRGVLLVFVGAASSIFILFLLNYYFQDLGFVARILERLSSIIRVLTEGVSSDNSMTLRLSSYVQFLSNLDVLGWGSFKLKDYSVFFENVGASFWLMAINPHSFFVEIGYWLGWVGLGFWLAFLIMMMSWSFGSILYALFSFVVLSMVSSSIFNNFMFFVAVFSALLVSQKSSSFSD